MQQRERIRGRRTEDRVLRVEDKGQMRIERKGRTEDGESRREEEGGERREEGRGSRKEGGERWKEGERREDLLFPPSPQPPFSAPLLLHIHLSLSAFVSNTFLPAL